jgi:hypothetical protein
MWIGFIWLWTGTVGGFCELGREPSGSIKGGNFLDYFSVLLAYHEGLSSMEFVG